MTILRNFGYYHGDEYFTGQLMVLENGLIRDILPEDALPVSEQDMDCGGKLLAPGFIDTQVNGGGGVMFNSAPTPDSLSTICRGHWSGGTTALLPTLITDSREHMLAAVEAVASVMNTGSLPGILGIHLEGPHLNVEKRGVHSPDFIRPFDANTEALLDRLPAACYLLTVAPEKLPPGTIKSLRQRGIHVSAGHTNASCEQIQAALAEGLDGFTHLYNAMTPMTSREPGVVGAALADPDSWCGIIVDGIHLHPLTARLAIDTKPRGKMMLVTDSMATIGSSSDGFELYGETITVRDGMCVNAAGALAGSALDMVSAVRHCVQLLGLPLAEALRMASLYPAQFLGVDQQRGKLAPGYRADLVLLNQELEVDITWVGAQIYYTRP